MAKYSSRTPKAKKKHSGFRTVLQVFGFMTAAVLAIAIGLGTAAYRDVNKNVQSEEYTQYLNKDRSVSASEDPLAGRALNYLLIGSDNRSGENGEIGGGNAEEGQRSDTTIVAHLSADRTRVDLVSIPRDSIVDIPSCKLSSGNSTKPVNNGQFNWAFSKGDNLPSAVACTISTIEENTEMFIDGYVVVDFSGFENIVDAVGGVTMDIPEDMVSKKANLNLKEGEQVLNGEEALAFARARTFEVGQKQGDGSDLGRIERQQELLGALASQILSSDTMQDPQKMYDVMESSLQSVTVSPELGSAGKLGSFAYGFRNISQENINFYTIPNTTWSQDANRVIWTNEADQYWEAMMNDTPIEVNNTNNDINNNEPTTVESGG